MQAFAGIRVLDLTHVLAGPFATYQLAVLGADVIKIEGPDYFDMNREIGAVAEFNNAMMGTHFQSQAANKRAITLNLKSEEGREIFLRLVDTADVIVENFRSGAMAKMGLGYEQIRSRKADIIYCSITGYGQTGPKHKDAAFDNAIQAYSGLMAQNGTEEEAVLVGPPVLDYGTGVQASFAIAAALLRRERSGEGQYLDVAMLDAALMLMTCGVLNAHTTGRTPGRTRYCRVPYAGYGGYVSADDELVMIGAATPAQYARLWRALGRSDLAERVAGLRTPDMAKNRETDEPIIAAAMRTKTADEWERILTDVGISVARVRNIDEALASDQIASRAVVGSYPSAHSKKGALKPSVAAFMCSDDGPSISTAPPEFGEHTREILAEIGCSEAEMDAMSKRGVI